MSKGSAGFLQKFLEAHPEAPDYMNHPSANFANYEHAIPLRYRQHASFADAIIQKQKPAASFRQYEREMQKAILIMERENRWLVSHAERFRLRGAHTLEFTGLTNRYFLHTSSLGNFKEIAKSFRKHWGIAAQVINTLPENWGSYSIGAAIGAHPESHLALQVWDGSGIVLGQVGGLIHATKKGLLFRITNIQGKDLKNPGPFWRVWEPGRDPYRELNRALGENWRVFLAKRLAALAKSKGMEVIGDPPRKFEGVENAPSPSQFRRLERQYRQTFRKAGIKFSGEETSK